MSTIVLHSTLMNTPKAVRYRGLVPKDHQ